MHDDDMIEEWFTYNVISPLNIYTVAMILTERESEKKNKEKLSYSISLYPYVLDSLIKCKKIDQYEKDKYLNLFKFLCKHDNIKSYASILIYISNNPNLLNDKWTLDSKFKQYKKHKSKCLPCRQ